MDVIITDLVSAAMVIVESLRPPLGNGIVASVEGWPHLRDFMQ